MYTLILCLCTLLSIIGFIYGCVEANEYFIIGSILFYIFYPILLELSINILSCVFYSEDRYLKDHSKKHYEVFKNMKNIFLVYHNRYNITACGIEKVHPFDSIKY